MYAVNAQIDLEYQRNVFFVLAAQVVLSAFDYPYFIAARKKQRSQVPIAYVPLCVALITIFWAIGLIDSTLKLSYCISLVLLITSFAKVYSVEAEGSVVRTTVLGMMRNASVTFVLLLYVSAQTQAMILVAASLCIYVILSIKKVFGCVGLPTLRWGEIGYCLMAAGLAGVFYVFDRQVVVSLMPTQTHVVNQVFIGVSVLMLLSNIRALNRSSMIVEKSQGVNDSWIPFVLALSGAVVLVLSGWTLGLIVWCLLASPVAFAMESPRLLAIQERQSARSTMIGYLLVMVLKIVALLIVLSLPANDWGLFAIPLIGVLCPFLILRISNIQTVDGMWSRT